MKTIKLFLLAICLISFSNAIAQEKQNDASWQETISFLKENISSYNIIVKSKFKNTQPSTTYSFNIEDDGILKSTKSDISYEANLKYLIRPVQGISKFGQTYFNLIFENGMVNKKYPGGSEREFVIFLPTYTSMKYDSNTKFSEGVLLFEKDDELPKSIFKAFQHLAYLAKEKRKESKF